MSAIITEVTVIALLLLINGLFSMSELALMTAKRSRLEHRADEEGDAGARAALDLAAHPTAFLSTVQVGITLVGVLAGAFGGAGIAEVLAEQFTTVSWLAPYASTAAFVLVVAVITYFSLILGELVPKRIALGNPERVAALIARPMRVIAKIGAPVVRVLTASTNFVLRLFGLGALSEPGVTEQDIRALVEQGAESGAVAEVEREIVENTFRLGDKAVDAMMTSRPDVHWIDLSGPPESIRAQLLEGVHESVLACMGDLDHIVGIVGTRDILARSLSGAAVDGAGLRSLATEPVYIPTTMPAFRLLETFRQAHRQTAVVLDEYGTVSGIVTLDDVLEALLGDVPSVDAAAAHNFEKRPDGSWLVHGTTPLIDVESRLDIDASDEERASVLTMAGFVMARLGRVPATGEHFDWHGRRVRVERMAGRRIESISVGASTRTETSTPSQPATLPAMTVHSCDVWHGSRRG